MHIYQEYNTAFIAYMTKVNRHMGIALLIKIHYAFLKLKTMLKTCQPI